jgi:hypothetical protein
MTVVEHHSVWLMTSALICLSGVDATVIALIVNGVSDDVSAIPLVITVTVVVAALVTAPLRLELTPTAILIRAMHVVSVRVQRDEIAQVGVIDVSPIRYGGVGVRAANGALAFVAGRKAAITIHTVTGKQYIFTTNRAPELVAELAR